MNYKRAALWGMMLYVASAVIGVGVSFIISPDVAAGIAEPGVWLLLAQTIMAVALSFGATWWYFMSPSTIPSAQNGLYFGLVAVVTSFVLDFCLFVPALYAGYTFADFASFYSQVWFWIVLVLILAGAAGAGFVRAGGLSKQPATPQTPEPTL